MPFVNGTLASTVLYSNYQKFKNLEHTPTPYAVLSKIKIDNIFDINIFPIGEEEKKRYD